MIKIPSAPMAILSALERSGFEAWVVGGCVRDSLLGLTPHDWDVCTSATPEEAEKALSDFRIIETGIQHGTVTAMAEGCPVEVTTYRTEGRYSDSRHPDSVEFVRDISQDLSRRDFTVNAMAYSPSRGLLDLYNGQKDLKNGQIRAVGDPEKRFNEDALRIMRALRFASTYGFEIEPETARAVTSCAHLLDLIAPERIFSELLRFLTGPGAGELLLKLPEPFFVVMPELRPMQGFDQHSPHHIYDVWEHTCRAVGGCENIEVLRLAVLLHDVGKPDTFTLDESGVGHFYGHPKRSAEIAEEILRRLRCPNKLREQTVLLIENHDRPAPETEKSMSRLVAQLGEENLRLIFKMHLADAAGKAPGSKEKALPRIEAGQELLDKVLRDRDCFSIKQLKINGDDLIAAGVPKGPAVGAELKRIFELVVDGELENERGKLMEEVMRGRG